MHRAQFHEIATQVCLHELYEQQVQRSAHAVAVRAGELTLSYAQLEAQANQLAHHLIAQGVGPETIVGVCLARSLPLSVALLAVLKAGGAYLPLDPELPAQRLAHMLRDAGARLVLTDVTAHDGLADAAAPRIALDEQAPAWAALPTSAPSQRAAPQHSAYVIYTSGSSGQPKAVAVSHRAMCNHQHWALQCMALGATHRLLQLITIGFDAAVLELFTPLLAGASLTMAPAGAQRDLRELVRSVRRHEITHLVMTPSLARALLDEPDLQHCTSVQHLLLGGEPLSLELVRALRVRLGAVRITNCYGPTEAATTATFHEVDASADGAGPVPIGRPIDNLRCHVLDGAMQPLPLGVVGELYIGGVGLADGYLNRPELTAERFVDDPWLPGQRLYRTGDLVRQRADGVLLFAGRADSQMKIRGQRIEPGEIEATLLRCAGVRQAAVAARADAHGDYELVACVVADAFDEAALREQLRQWLPAALVPAALLALPALPLLPSGKLDVRALPLEASARTTLQEPPATDTERALHTLWCQLLQRPSFSRHDNFFECGGHSLTATRLVARIRSRLHTELPLRAVFEHPTLTSLATAVDATPRTAIPRQEESIEAASLAARTDEPLALTPQQQGVWLAERLGGNGLYNLVQATRIEGELDLPRLQQALAQLVTRHEALRLAVFDDEGTPHQQVRSGAAVPWVVHDLRALPQAERTQAVDGHLRMLAAHHFDFERAPLLRVVVLRLAREENMVALLAHHLVFDGASAATLMREWATLYAQPDATLPPVAGYRDFLAWQQCWLAGTAAQEQLQDQRAHLAGTPMLELPSDRVRPERHSLAGAALRFEIDAQRTQALCTLAASENVTPFMLLMALFQAQMRRLSGQHDFAVGTPAAARLDERFESTIGLFTNTLVLRARMTGDPSFTALLADVREEALRAYQHQGLPFDRLAEVLPESQRGALFQVGLAWQNMGDTTLRLPGTRCSSLPVRRDVARMDLWLSFSECDGELHGELEYASDLFDAATAQRLAMQYRRMVDAVLADATVPLSRLDRTDDAELQLPSGKLDVRALPLVATARSTLHEPPATDTERALHALWCQLLQRQSFSRHDNFFECGGHSLTATRLVARIRSQLHADLPLRTVFEHPTLTALAAAIDRALDSTTNGREQPIEPASREQPLPLSHSQQRMWLLQQMDPEGVAYNMPFATRIKGALRPQALREALAHLTARHEALRTSLQMELGAPTQRIAAQAVWPLAEVDLSSIATTAAREQRARELAQQESHKPFDLGRAPMARALLMTLADDDHVLLIVVHHAIGDQWSGGVLARDLAMAYEAALAGTAPQWALLRIQYADYCVWQRAHQGDSTLDAELAYWRARLHGAPALALPAYGGVTNGATASQGASTMCELPADAIGAMRRLAAAHGATPFMVLLAAFKLLLSRYCGQTDIVLGTPIANRLRADTEDLVGTMVNTLVMRTDLAGDPSFVELLQRVKETALQAYAHQNLPYERLVDELRGEGNASPANVRVLFNVPNAPAARPHLALAEVSPFDFDRGAAQFDLTVTVDTEHSHRVLFEYATAVFSPATVRQLATHYLHLLEQALLHPHAPLSKLLTLTPHERHAVLRRRADTARELPDARRVDLLIAAQAARTPAAVAISQGPVQWSFAELEGRANRLANHLQRLGVGRGALVGLCLQRTPDMVMALLAVLKTGAAYVPLDPAFPRERLRFMVRDSGLSWVITHDAVSNAPAPSPRRLLNLDVLAGRIAAETDQAAPNLADGYDLAYVLYTSGSTGQPKGVEIEHRSLLNFIASMQRAPGASAQDTLLAVTTLSFDIAGLELLLPLSVGARVELATRDEAADPHALIDRLAAVRPTLMQATPTTWNMLVEAGWSGDPHLTALCGGEPLGAQLSSRLLTRCSALWNLYGPTETTIWSTLDAVQPDAPITIGRAIDNTTCFVLDDNRQPVPFGVTGELYIGGMGVARGYRNRPQLTAERFVPDPFSDEPGARLYRTGDLARQLPDGRLVHQGRNDFQVKLRGFRIELGEVESALAGHGSVAHCAVAAKDDPSGHRQLVAYVVLRTGASLDRSALRTYLRGVLPDYMVPAYFIALPSLPLTANRKVDVPALPPPSTADAVEREPDSANPQGLLAVQLLALWRQALDDATLGLHDDFFEHGGHSLKAVQLLTLIERVFGRRLPLATLIEAPTVARLEHALSRADWKAPWRSLVALGLHGAKPPLFIVPGVGGNVLVFTGLAKLLDGERPVYGLQARGLDGIEPPLRTIEQMAAHHVAEVRAVRPRGPYVIAGACTGGVVAYEMARMLRALDEDVELIVLESWHPSSYRRPPGAWRAWQRLRTAIKRIRASVRTLVGLSPQRWPAGLLRLLRPEAHSEVTLEETLAGHDYLADRVVAATFEAVACYEARIYPGRVLNVIAIDRPLAPDTADTRRAWGSLALGGARTIELPAEDSGRLFVSPHLERLSEILREHLSEAA